MSGESKGFIAALDVGTTTLRCHIIDSTGAAVGIANSDGLRTISYIGYIFTRLAKLHLASQLRFSSLHVTVRLLWILRHNEEVQQALKDDDVSFGTMETWLLEKLTGGKSYFTDISNASVTGLFDPTALCWSFVPRLMGIPTTLLPPVADNDCKFGDTLREIFGVPIRIGSVMADQSASMYGSCSFKENDLKLTLGTGAFMNVNTGEKIHASLNGMYPLIGWKVKNRLTYALEISCSDAGSLVQWMLNAGLLSNSSESSSLASKLSDNGGVYFVPAFSGLGPPISNETAATGFIGVTPKTTKDHLVRAVLESIAFRVALAYNMLRKERAFAFRSIKVDGGVSKNDFICQMVSDLTDLKVERLSSEMSVLGAAYVAGLSCGMWSSESELTGMIKIQRTFLPTNDPKYKKSVDVSLHQWQRAAERFLSWYEYI
ncbi:putative glycerol kinase 5 isoform X2 [Cylas formicarius]|uniref:putative glycerol kinase 5 isoform X2 n=1 Tax=Cylas formicarius TaxID=197179 RepID=UPI0029586CFD|nr:putative glycerol kinase 5 isoform X2 [Cylas formicarius]